MVPNIGKSGTSFTGAGAYFLHDKPFQNETGETVNPRSANRVAFTETRNLANDDPDKAIVEMWRTAEAQAQIKKAAGVDPRGRKCTDPVKTISLAWHPDDTPTRTDMIEAADDFLATMNWQGHQALLVAHTDTQHAHIHIILNRVHPETGRTIDDFREQYRAQKWAAGYERAHPHFRACPRGGGPEHDGPAPKSRRSVPNALEKEGREQEQPFVDASDLIQRLDGSERDLIHKLQTDEREAFFATAKRDFRAARQAAFHDVGAEYKARWREHFNDAKMIRGQARELAAENAGEAFRLAREGKLGAAWATLEGRDKPDGFDPIAHAEAHIEARAKALATEQAATRKERQERATQRTFEQRNARFIAIKERQKDERAELRDMAGAHARGEPVDIARLRALLTGDTRTTTDPGTLLRDLKRANDNASALTPSAANDNRDPQRQLKAARVRADGAHMTRLFQSIQMTNSPGMAATQTQALKELTRRTRITLERTQKGEATDRIQRFSPELKPGHGDDEQSRGGGRGRGRGGRSDP